MDELRAKALQGTRGSKKTKEARKTRNENNMYPKGGTIQQKSAQSANFDTFGPGPAGDPITRSQRKGDMGEKAGLSTKVPLRASNLKGRPSKSKLAPYNASSSLALETKKPEPAVKPLISFGIVDRPGPGDWSRYQTPLKKKGKSKAMQSQEKQGTGYKRDGFSTFNLGGVKAAADGRVSTGSVLEIGRPLESSNRSKLQARSQISAAKKPNRGLRQQQTASKQGHEDTKTTE